MEIKHRLHPTIPARGRKMFVLRHEKLYLTVHRQLMKKWFRYTVLFFIVGAIFSVICSSFESSAPYRLQLYSFSHHLPVSGDHLCTFGGTGLYFNDI